MTDGRRRNRAVLALLGALGFGCVNDYVVDETRGDGSSSENATESADDTSTSTTGDPDTTMCVGDECMGTTLGSGDGTGTGDDTSASTSDTGAAPGLCGQCASDAECAPMFGLCVMLGESGRCLVPCTEQRPPCPDGYECIGVESVDGETAQQCAPIGGVCEGS